jgi:penicillin-binding protein 1A
VRFDPGDPVDFVQQPQTSVVEAADGTVLAELHAEQDRQDVSLDEVADVFETAVVAVEDRRFFSHHGVDASAIVRAAVRNIEAGEISEGGSTITQQYVKNTITGPALTLERKLQEAVAAWQLEEQYSKEEILERYLNTVYFGKGAYGVRAASRRFFGIEPAHLALDQAALLAGVIASPSRYDPFENPDLATSRRERVLKSMVEVGAITQDEAESAAAAPLELAELREARMAAPHVVEEVKRIIREDPTGALGTRLGESPDDRMTALFTGGLRVITTLDLTAQAQAEAAVGQVVPEGGPAAAVVATDPATGAIRALVGGRDFYDETDPTARFNLATQGRRQPGSSFKPIVLALALERGIDLEQVYPGGSCVSFPELRQPWEPCNYGGTAYAPMTLREATVRSVNTVFARLAVEFGPAAIVEMAVSLGLSADLPQVHSLALGTGEVSPLEMAGAFGTFANEGRYIEPHLIDRIETLTGDVLYRHNPTSYQAIGPATAYLVTQALEEVVARGTGVRANIGRPQAGKTGTSQDNADAWFVGYTPDLVAAVWVGFTEGRRPMRPPNTSEVVEGGRWPAEIWRAFASEALRDVPPSEFEIPAVELVRVAVDITRNCLPNPYTPPELIEERDFLRGTEPTELCTEPTGPPIEDVPDVIGLPRAVAERLLRDRGFLIEIRPYASRRYPPGIVEFQRPAPGGTTQPQDGNAVILWVSTSVRTRSQVPDVVEVALGEAIRMLEAAGWVVAVEEACPDTGCTGDTTRVWRQTPPAATIEIDHSLIVITVEPPPAPEPTETPPSPAPTETDTGTDTETDTGAPPSQTEPAAPAPEPSPTA